MRLGAALLIGLLLVPSMTVAGSLIEFGGHAVEGGLMTGRVAPGATVTLDGKRVATATDGNFFIGFGRDSAGRKQLIIQNMSGETEVKVIDVADREFKIERIDGLPRRKVTPDPADVARIGRERSAITSARNAAVNRDTIADAFVWPATGRISGVYGSQRILNGKPRRPHYGTDIAAPTGTSVGAMAAGRVIFTHPGMFFNGKTVLIDHGLGLRSIYIHMSEIFVVEGQRVLAGEKIGAIGKTGRATGPHLHFGLEWGKVPLDPEVVLGPMPK